MPCFTQAGRSAGAETAEVVFAPGREHETSTAAAAASASKRVRDPEFITCQYAHPFEPPVNRRMRFGIDALRGRAHNRAMFRIALACLAPFLDAKGDPGSGRWSFVIPTRNGSRNNLMICTSDRYCGLVNPDSSRDQFLGSTAISPDGTYWASYHTFTPNVANPVSNIVTHIVRIPPGNAPLAAYATTHGTAPSAWRLLAAGSYGSSRCSYFACYAAGDYNRMAVDNAGVTAVPLLQQSAATQTNDLFGIFTSDPAGVGVFYAPYSIEPPGSAEHWKAASERFSSITEPLPLSSAGLFFDPPAALGPATDAPDPRWTPNFVRYPAGADLRTLGTPAPFPAKDPYPDLLRGKIPDYFKNFPNVILP